MIFSQSLMAQVVIKNADFVKRRMPDSYLLKTKETQNYKPPVNMSLIGQMTYGQTFAINSKDSIVFFSEDRWLVIADYSNPTNPKILSRVRVPNIIGRIRRVNNYLYVVTKYRREFSIIDISDPYNPKRLGSYSSGTSDIAIYGNYAYTAHKSRGMYILNISDPKHVTEIKRLKSSEDVLFLFEAEGYLYRNYGYNLEILSLSDPLNPKIVSSIPTGYDMVKDFIIEDNFLYCCIRDMGLWVIDVTDKYNPTIISKYKGDWQSFNRIAKKDSRIYASTYASGLSILDYSNINEPKEVGKIDQLEHVSKVHINKNILYVGDSTDGVYVFDISNADTLDLLSSDRTFGFITDVAIKDSVAFLADTFFGIRIVNISNPKVPFEIGWFRTPGRQQDVLLNKGYLFVSGDTSGLNIYDITNIDKIEEVCTIKGYQTIACEVDSNILYLSARGKGLRIFDISDIYNPVEIGHYRPESFSFVDKAIIKAPYAYLLNSLSRVIIIDITDKTNPKFVNDVVVPHQVLSMDIQSQFIYSGTNGGGVVIYDMSDPYNIFEVGHHPKPYSEIWPIITNKNERYIYYGAGNWGLEVLNIKDKTKPVVCASYYTDSIPEEFIVKNDTIYFTDLYDGMYILKHDKTTAVEVSSNIRPIEFCLEQNYPNPFNSQTKFTYQLAGKSWVELAVYNSLGQKISTLVDEQKATGHYSAQWDASDVASGIYFYRLTVSNEKNTFSGIKKCILLK